MSAVREVAIISGKGGTGKTGLAAAFARLAAPIAVVDADVDAANLHLVLAPQERERHEHEGLPVASVDPARCRACGACLAVCRFGALARGRHGIAVDDDRCEGCGACALACPAGAILSRPRRTGVWMVGETEAGPLVHARLDPGAEHAGRLTTAVRARGRALAAERGLGLVLIDGPPGIGCAATAAIAGADLAVAVTEPTPAAAADLVRLRERIAQLRVPLALIINRADRNPLLAQRLAGEARAAGDSVLGAVPADPAFRRAQVRGCDVLAVAEAPLRAAITACWERLVARLAAHPARTAS